MVEMREGCRRNVEQPVSEMVRVGELVSMSMARWGVCDWAGEWAMGEAGVGGATNGRGMLTGPTNVCLVVRVDVRGKGVRRVRMADPPTSYDGWMAGEFWSHVAEVLEGRDGPEFAWLGGMGGG